MKVMLGTKKKVVETQFSKIENLLRTSSVGSNSSNFLMIYSTAL
jgi:hypothetical protein